MSLSWRGEGAARAMNGALELNIIAYKFRADAASPPPHSLRSCASVLAFCWCIDFAKLRL